MKKIVLLFLISVFYALNAEAVELYESYTSVRGLGMGNAYSSVVNTREALWYNPAGLDRIKGFHLTILDLNLGTDAYDVYTTYTQATGGDFSSLIHSFFGKHVWVGVSDEASFSTRGLGLAAYDNLSLSANLHDPSYSNLNLNFTNDIGFIGGMAFSLLPQDVLRFGFAVKRVTRYGARMSFGPSVLATLSNSQILSQVANYGTGYGLDGGLLIELPTPVRPTFSAVWHDIGQTKFTTVSGTNAPPPLDNEAVAGFSMTFDASVVKITPAFDYKHINLQNEQLGKKMHFGVEMAFPVLALRGGFNQGYYTAGFGIDLKYFLIDAATYGVELQTYPGQLEDRRYILQLTLDLNFDPNIDLKSSGRNSVYQRR